MLIWNIESNEPGWYQSVRDLYQPLDLGTPQYYRGWWRKCFEVEACHELYEPPEQGTSEWTIGMTEDQVGFSWVDLGGQGNRELMIGL